MPTVLAVLVVILAILLSQGIVSFSFQWPGSEAGSQALILIMVGATLLVIAAVLLGAAVRTSRGAFGAAMYLTAVAVPFTAAVYTIGAYVLTTQSADTPPVPVHPLREIALPLGLGATLVTWLAAAWILRGLATAERANESLYGELQSRLSRLERWTECWPSSEVPSATSGKLSNAAAVPWWRSPAVIAVADAVALVAGMAALVRLIRDGAAGAFVTYLAAGAALVRARGDGGTQGDGARGEPSSEPGDPPEPAGPDGDRAGDSQRQGTRDEVGRKEAIAHTCAVRGALGRRGESKAGLSWVTGQGYIDCWRRIHRAEEALVAVAPRYELVRWVNDDDLRLQGANIPTAVTLKAKLLSAATALGLERHVSPEDDEPSTDEAPAPGAATHQADGSALAAAAKKAAKANADLLALVSEIEAANAATPEAQQEKERAERDARAVIAEVRHTINDYRDELWAGMLRERNRLIRMALFTGVTAYILVTLAVIVRVPADSLAAAAVFYLVGALAGLFGMINSDAPPEPVVEDYGLSSARLVQTRLLSGLAGVGGVVLAALFTGVYTLADPSGEPSPSASPGASPAVAVASASPNQGDQEDDGAEGPAATRLIEAFRLPDNAIGLLVAAVFGLTPGLLTKRLEAQAKQWGADLNSSEPTGASTTPSTTGSV